MIATRWLGCQRIELAECGSTNDEAGRLARAGAKHGTVVIAHAQKAGRGRDGRVWESAVGGLYLSAVLRPPLPLLDVPPMTLAIGIGVCDAARAAGAAAVLKWPNDVLVGGRKLSASVATVEILPDADGARLLFTEQGVYFGEDGWAEREEGTAFGMDQLARWLASEKETA